MLKGDVGWRNSQKGGQQLEFRFWLRLFILHSLFCKKKKERNINPFSLCSFPISNCLDYENIHFQTINFKIIKPFRFY